MTDAIRGEWLEKENYRVQMLEFIDIEHTPKNILIRAIKKQKEKAKEDINQNKLAEVLKIQPEILKN